MGTRVFKNILGLFGLIFIFVLSLSLCFSVDLIERINLGEARTPAEANIHSLNHLSPEPAKPSEDHHSPLRPSYLLTKAKSPNQGQITLSAKESAKDFQNITVSGDREGSFQEIIFLNPKEEVSFFDGLGFVECFNLTELNNDLEEIEMVLIFQEEGEENFFKLIESRKEEFHFRPSPWPTRGWISSSFGYRTSPFTWQRVFHKGIDIASHHGSPIYATNRGVIIFSGRKGEYGNAVIIQHGFGYSTLYGHNSINVVKSGQKVEQGQLIGYVGNTGKSTAPHVHYEVRKDDRCINPGKYLTRVAGYGHQ